MDESKKFSERDLEKIQQEITVIYQSMMRTYYEPGFFSSGAIGMAALQAACTCLTGKTSPYPRQALHELVDTLYDQAIKEWEEFKNLTPEEKRLRFGTVEGTG